MDIQLSKLQEYLVQDSALGLTGKLFAAGIGLYLLKATGTIIYRLTLHPLARFPGPFLCRIGYFQQTYYEAILNGKFLERLPEYHRTYGPVVRINPNEVHISDPAVFHTIYKQNTHFTKDPVTYALGMSNAITMTMQVDAHKVKRQTLDPCFSKRRVNTMEDGLYEELELLFAKISEYENRGEEVPIQELYYCYTGDIISRYLFGKSLDIISAPNFIERSDEMRSFTRNIWFVIHFPWIRAALGALPKSLVFDSWQKVIWFCEDLSKDAIARFKQSSGDRKSPNEETIFDRMLTDDARRREKGQDSKPLTFHELTDESLAILNAGTEPTATMMAYATYFYLHYTETQKRIMEELESVQRNEHGRLPLQSLENLPYFTGFIRETLRFIPLVPGRLPRVVPKGGLFVPSIKDTIPAGSVVGIDHIAIHKDPEIFERPEEFLPERWMDNPGKELNHWLVSFSKGRMDCIGKNLAYAELYLVMANLFTRFDMELGPGSVEGMEWLDRVVIHPKKNLRIKVTGKPIMSVS